MSLNDNLTSHWALTADANDAVGGLNLTNTNVTIDGNGALFDNASDDLTRADNSAFKPSGDFTIAFWVNVSSVASGSFFSHEDTNGWRARFETSNSIRFLTFAGAGQTLVDKSSAISTGSLQLIVCYRSGTTLGISINGGAATTNSGTLRNLDDIGTFHLGQSKNTDDPIIGRIRTVSFWNSRALSSTEITQYYNSGTPLTYPFPATISVSDSLAMSTADTVTLILAFIISVSDVFTGITDALRTRFGWINESKNNVNVINESKP